MAREASHGRPLTQRESAVSRLLLLNRPFGRRSPRSLMARIAYVCGSCKHRVLMPLERCPHCAGDLWRITTVRGGPGEEVKSPKDASP